VMRVGTVTPLTTVRAYGPCPECRVAREGGGGAGVRDARRIAAAMVRSTVPTVCHVHRVCRAGSPGRGAAACVSRAARSLSRPTSVWCAQPHAQAEGGGSGAAHVLLLLLPRGDTRRLRGLDGSLERAQLLGARHGRHARVRLTRRRQRRALRLPRPARGGPTRAACLWHAHRDYGFGTGRQKMALERRTKSQTYAPYVYMLVRATMV
jgi:hypothetical protein